MLERRFKLLRTRVFDPADCSIESGLNSSSLVSSTGWITHNTKRNNLGKSSRHLWFLPVTAWFTSGNHYVFRLLSNIVSIWLTRHASITAPELQSIKVLGIYDIFSPEKMKTPPFHPLHQRIPKANWMENLMTRQLKWNKKILKMTSFCKLFHFASERNGTG